MVRDNVVYTYRINEYINKIINEYIKKIYLCLLNF